MASKPSGSTIYEAPAREYQVALEGAERAPMPARVDKIVCGTAGWTDPTLLRAGLFYPRGVKTARERLAYYARHFPFVEVDATYYALIPAAQAVQWVANTPDSFTFDVKAHPVITGQPFEVARLPAPLKEQLEHLGFGGRVYGERIPEQLAGEIERRFDEFLQPLHEAGRLGSLLLQFPPWFARSAANLRRLERVAERWSHVPLTVEFRHPSWLAPENTQSCAELLSRRELSLVLVDAPQGTGLGQAPLIVTNPRLVVVRFHGRNHAGWQQKGASVHDRFSYLYGPDELRPWAGRLLELATRAERVHATFNNCYRNYAVLDAKLMAALLSEASGPDDPLAATEAAPRGA